MNSTNMQKQNDGNGGLEKMRARELTPAVDVYENDAELLIVVDLPGVTHEHLDLKINPPELRFEAKSDAEGSIWRRSFTVDEHIDANKVSADLKNGVLTIRLPKAEEVKPRTIKVDIL